MNCKNKLNKKLILNKIFKLINLKIFFDKKNKNIN